MPHNDNQQELTAFSETMSAVDDVRLRALLSGRHGLSLDDEMSLEVVAGVVAEVAEDTDLDPNAMNAAIEYCCRTLRPVISEELVRFK